MAKETAKKVELVAKDGTTAKDVNQQFIINYCVKNNEIAWLKEQRNAEVKALKYPLSDAPVNEGGRRKQDKTKAPTETTRHYTFLEIKQHFIAKFYPELVPAKKPKKESFFDLLDKL